MLADAASVMNLTAAPPAAPAAADAPAEAAVAAAPEAILGAKELKIQTPVGGEIVVPLDEVRRVYGDVWVPAEGLRTRSGRQVKPVKRFVQEVYEDDKTDSEDEIMSTDDEDLDEANSEDEAFVADDDEEEEAEADAAEVAEEEDDEESSADSAETEDEEEEVYSGESDDEDEEDDDDFFSSEDGNE
jgi:hypothetical protein